MPDATRYPVYVRSFLHFFHFSPKQLIWLNALTLSQGITGSLGFLMLIPLAQLAGVDISQYTAQHSGIVNDIVEFVQSTGIGHSLESVLVSYTLLSLMLAGLSYHRALLGAKLQQRYVRQMRSNLYKTLLEADWSYLSSRRSSEYLHRVGTQVQSMNVSAYQLIGLMHQLLMMSVYTFLMLFIHWQFTAATIVIGVLVGLMVFPVRYSVRDSGQRQLRGYQEIFASLAEHLSSLKMIKVSAREAQFHEVIGELSEELEYQEVRMTRAGSIVSFANTMGMVLGFCCLLFVAVKYVNVPLADFLILLVIMSRIMPKIAGLQQTVQGIVFSVPAFKDIEETLIEAGESQEIVVAKEVKEFTLLKSIDLVNVNFNYPLMPEKPIFENLSLTIKKNETIALGGPSGIGKTTLADLIASLLQPVTGQLQIDGRVLQGDTLLAWRRAVAYVTQDVYLFNTSVRQNLLWMAPEATEQEIWTALEMAEMADRVKGMPNQLQSHIGDRGVRLSGGERQRLALARALLTQPQVLILDEATSALDDDTEQKIHEVIKGLRGRLTVIIIAHRQSTLGLADRVINVQALVS